MITVTFSNSIGSIQLGYSPPYILQRFEGGSGSKCDLNIIKAPMQDGEFTLQDANGKIQNYLDKKQLVVSGAIIGNSLTDLNNKKKELSRIFNPKYGSTLLYNNGTYEREIECVVEMSPAFNSEKSGSGFYYQLFSSTLRASRPFWLDKDWSGGAFSLSKPMFKFDLILTDNYEFETDGENRRTFTNAGDVDAPVYIEFNGPATNPKIINETTGEFIKVTKVLAAYEKLIINTTEGNKYVIFNSGSTEENAFGLLSHDSKLFSLIPGNNTISYTADFGIATASALVKYKNRYIDM